MTEKIVDKIHFAAAYLYIVTNGRFETNFSLSQLAFRRLSGTKNTLTRFLFCCTIDTYNPYIMYIWIPVPSMMARDFFGGRSKC